MSRNGQKEFEFDISRKSDSDCSKQQEHRRNILGLIIYMEGGQVMFKSATQKHTALSATEAELYVGESTVQDMVYMRNFLIHWKLR